MADLEIFCLTWKFSVLQVLKLCYIPSVKMYLKAAKWTVRTIAFESICSFGDATFN